MLFYLNTNKQSYKSILICYSEELKDLIDWLLETNEKNRPTIQQILKYKELQRQAKSLGILIRRDECKVPTKEPNPVPKFLSMHKSDSNDSLASEDSKISSSINRSRFDKQVKKEPKGADLKSNKQFKGKDTFERFNKYPELDPYADPLPTIQDLARGWILGAFVGDAAGAVLEFYHKKITQKDVDAALKFQGGGALGVRPGQFTDDSEMAMWLLHALIQGRGKVNQHLIGNMYYEWLWSEPFDIGITTKQAISWIEGMLQGRDSLKICLWNIERYNHKSQSNGSLMRTTPLAVFCHKLKDANIHELTKKDVNLTHSHEIVVYATTCYNIAIAHLLNNPGDAKGAIERAGDYVYDINDSDFIDHWANIVFVKREEDLIRADKLIGFIIIAFSYAFFYLKNDYTYEQAINNMLLHGGDTDTNAAIVGGLLGARFGINGIPKKWRNAVINCENDRPDFLKIKSEKEIYGYIDELIEYAPEDTKNKQVKK